MGASPSGYAAIFNSRARSCLVRSTSETPWIGYVVTTQGFVKRVVSYQRADAYPKPDHDFDHNPMGIERGSEGCSVNLAKKRPANGGFQMAAGEGFEPSLTDPESDVNHPLSEAAIRLPFAYLQVFLALQTQVIFRPRVCLTITGP